MGVAFRELPGGRSRWRLPQSRDRGLQGSTHCGYCVHGSHLLPTDHDRRDASRPATRCATGIRTSASATRTTEMHGGGASAAGPGSRRAERSPRRARPTTAARHLEERHREVVLVHRPGPGDDTAGDDEVRPAADDCAVPRRHDVWVRRPRPEHPLVVRRAAAGRRSSAPSRRARRRPPPARTCCAVDDDIGEPVVQVLDPPWIRLRPALSPAAEPVLQVVGRRWAVRADVRLDRVADPRPRGPGGPPSAGCGRGAGTSARPSRDGPKVRSPCHASALSSVHGVVEREVRGVRGTWDAADERSAPSSAGVSG